MSRLFRSLSRGSSKRHTSDPIQIEPPAGNSKRHNSIPMQMETLAGNSKRHNSNPIQVEATSTTNPNQIETKNSTNKLVYPIDELVYPFGDLGLNISDSELRETAYEILVAACRSSGGKPLTYIPQSDRSFDQSSAPVTSLQKSLSSSASRMKKAWGLKMVVSGKRMGTGGGDSMGQGRVKKAVTIWELIRVQMKVSEQSDSRIRRALLRVASAQLGRRIESTVLPLELLKQLKATDFPSHEAYKTWQRRNLKILEAGLLLHPHMPFEKTNAAPQHLRKIIHTSLEKTIDMGKNNESMRILQNLVMSLSCRSFDGSVSDTCHWADGFPLNLRLYQMLLESCFDVNEETSIIEEVDEVLEILKKTWAILGMNQMLHNLCFSWVLFHRYVITGQVENDLIIAANNLLLEVENDAKGYKDPVYSKILNSTVSSISGWSEKKLISYHDSFHNGNIESMGSIVSISVLSAKILVEDASNENRRKRKEVDVAFDRVNNYIRSSLQSAFGQKMEKIKSRKHLSENLNNPVPLLSILAQDVSALAFNEKAMFSPMLKKWHPLAAGVAAATLHSCYGKELKKFVSGINELTSDAIEVLNAADKLEKDLVQIAVADSVESEDGGKSIIQEMPPYEAEARIADFVKSWIRTRVDKMKECIDRFLQQEVWSPQANKERFAPSVVEVLRITDETFEAFFLLPVAADLHATLLPDLVAGLDKCLQQYILKANSGCGSRSTYIPTLPALTRCSAGSKFSVFKKKERSRTSHRRKMQNVTRNGEYSLGIPQLCVCINTLHHIQSELVVLEKRTVTHLKKSGSIYANNFTNGLKKWFDLSSASCTEGIQQLCEATAYKVIFRDLSHVLWEGLYIGEVESSRIEPFLQELDQYLEIISSTVHENVRMQVFTDVMKASFHGFLLVLLAGGPSRNFITQDSEVIEEDFKFLADLFWSNGDGLPSDLIDKYSTKVKGILQLFYIDSESLIKQFKCVNMEIYGSTTKSRLVLPPTSGDWDSSEPNTLLRVLCYRNDETAAKFLKKAYNLPKKL